MTLNRVVPVFVICALALAVAVKSEMGKKNQTLDGLVVQDDTIYEFYPGVSDCERHGMPYLIIPDSEFYAMVQTHADFEHLERLFHGEWRVKLNGDLSRIGRYEYRKTYWRELLVNYVVDARQLSCDDAHSGNRAP